MTYNLTQIMTAAWSAARNVSPETRARQTIAQRRARFVRCLRDAWMSAKVMARHAAQKAALALISADSLRTQIITLECKDRLTCADFQHLAALQSALNINPALAA
jgi:hypothetical protein